MDQQEIDEIDRLLRELLALSYHRDGVKQCGACGTKKPIAEFHKQSSRPDGLNLNCAECRRQYQKKRYEVDAENMRSKAKEYYHRMKGDPVFRDKQANSHKRWVAKNLERRREIARESSLRHGKDWYAALKSDDIRYQRRRETDRENMRRHRRELGDYYVRAQVMGAKKGEIPQSLIEVKRLVIQIKRYIQEKS